MRNRKLIGRLLCANTSTSGQQNRGQKPTFQQRMRRNVDAVPCYLFACAAAGHVQVATPLVVG